MLSAPFEVPLWIGLIFLALITVFLTSSSIGVYYVFSKKFEKITLLISALIHFLLIMPKSLNPYHWSGLVTMYLNLESLIVLTLTYLAIFSVVNFIYRMFYKITRRYQ